MMARVGKTCLLLKCLAINCAFSQRAIDIDSDSPLFPLLESLTISCLDNVSECYRELNELIK